VTTPAVPWTDAELIARTRTGDMTAYDELYRRHIDGAQRVARIVTGSADEAQDVVSEAFTRVLDRLQHGGGPDSELGPYLNTIVRRLAIDRYRASRRDGLPADPTLFEVMPEADDPISRSTDRELVRRAFETLPERWQQVLWHTEIEGRTAAALAPSLGSTPNAVAALAYRAREGLRQAYLSVHLSADIPERCRPYVPKLAAYVRGTLSPRDDQWVAAHVENCPHCRDRRDELMLLVADLRGVLWPALLLPVVFGGAKTAAAAGAAGIAGAGAAAAEGAKGGAAGGAGGGAGGIGAAGVVAGAAGAAGIAAGVAAGAAATGGSAGAAAAAGSAGAAGGAGAAGAAGVAAATAAAGTGAAGGIGAGAATAAGWLARIPKPKSLAAQITTAAASVAAVSAIVVSAAVIASDDEPPSPDDGTVAAPLDPGRVGPPASVPRPSPQPTQSPPAASPSTAVPPVLRPVVPPPGAPAEDPPDNPPPAGVDPGVDPTASARPSLSSSPTGAGSPSPSVSSAVPSPTSGAAPSGTPSPTRTATSPSTPTPTPTPTATETSTPSPTPTPTVTPTPSPTPTPTETSTPSPTPIDPTATPTIPPPADPPPWWWRWFCQIFPWWPTC
jgi:RNA polymerase sigma factor (sigma-70 family)